MRLGRAYALDPAQEEPLRRTFLKGLGATVVLISIAVAASWAGGFRTGQGAAFFSDAFTVLGIVFVLHHYSRTLAIQRLMIGREAAKKNRHEEVVAALLPFARSGFPFNRSRFDRTGEAHYLLYRSARALGEDDLARYARTFVLRFRRGEWAAKIGGDHISE